MSRETDLNKIINEASVELSKIKAKAKFKLLNQFCESIYQDYK